MPGRNLPTGTVTFLFSDIEGSTRLLQVLGRDAYRELLETHNEIVRGVAGDAVVSTEGDSFFCAFSTPARAVAAAVAIQRGLDDHEWPGGRDVRVRMGIHTGEGVLGGDNYVGLDVHKAARIAAAAHGRQVLASGATRAQVAAGLPESVGLRDLGEHRLKDLAEPEHLFQLTIPGLPDEFPPPRSLEAPTNLPEHLSSFVGRGVELAEIGDALSAARLVTLIGPGGAGKTRLAIEAGRATIPEYPGGVFFATLADVDDPNLVAAHIADELSIPEQVGRPIERTLVEYLAPRRSLLVVDNCEHVADAAAGLTEDLLRSCPHLTLLATSREALLIPGEQLYEVGPMSLPEDGEIVDSDAVRLFATRAGAVSPGFEIDRWAEEVAQICAHLDGIPLAVELAAARVVMLTPAEILDRLSDRFGLLRSRSRTTTPRQRTLEGAIDWSYDLLDDDARRLLRSLSIFRGGFTLEAVAEVCVPDGTSEVHVLDLLTELHEKSLLTQQTTFTGTRFGLLETIRQYAAIRLHRNGEFEDTASRHRRYFTELARMEAYRLGRQDQLDALAKLEAEHDNFRAVMRRALAQDDFDAAVDIAGRLVWFWYLHAHFTEGERWAARMLAALPEDPSRPWVRLLLGSAQYDYRIGNYVRAEERLRLALQLSEGQDHSAARMWTHAYLATNALYTTDLDGAEREARRAQRLAQDGPDFIALAYATFLLVSVAAYRAVLNDTMDRSRAESLLDRLEPVATGARTSGERNIIGHVLQLEGALRAAAGDARGAADSYDEAVMAFTELGTVGCACHCLEGIAEFAASGGSHRHAVKLIGATDRLRETVGITHAGVEEYWRERAVALCAAALEDEVLSADLQAGAALSLAEAAQLARETLARIQGTTPPAGSF